jgi:hypothetical protein
MVDPVITRRTMLATTSASAGVAALGGSSREQHAEDVPADPWGVARRLVLAAGVGPA